MWDSDPLVFMGDFNFPDKTGNIILLWQTDRSWKFLRFVGDNFLPQVLSEPTRKEVLQRCLWIEKDSYGMWWQGAVLATEITTGLCYNFQCNEEKGLESPVLPWSSGEKLKAIHEPFSRLSWEYALRAWKSSSVDQSLRKSFWKQRNQQFHCA